MNEYNPAPASTDGGISAEERQWAMFAHLSALLGPLVIWLVKKDTMPFVDDQAKEALNFNITVAIAFFVLFLMTVFTLGIGIILTGPLFVIVGIAWLVLTVIAGIKANQGERYRYPLTLRLVK